MLADPLPGPVGHCDTVPVSDGSRLFRRRWPSQVAGRGVLLVHGLGEHSGRYRHLATWFNARGWDVCSYDQRGHGQTAGRRGVLPRPGVLLDDLGVVFADYASQFDTPPLLFGHSMGGLLAARAVLSGALQPAGLVLSSPALRTHEPGWLRVLAAMLARLWPSMPLRHGVQRAYLSRDARVVQACAEDPHCHTRITPRLADFIFRTGPACIDRAGMLGVQTLLLAAGEDRVVDPSGSRDFIAGASPAVLQGALLEGCYHEIFNEAEPVRSRVFARLGAWLDTHFP